MPLSSSIEKRICELGGRLSNGDLPMKESLLGITFPHYLYPSDWDLYGVDEFFAEHKSTYETSPDAFLDQIESHYFAAHDRACGQDFWQPKHFTPTTPGTADFKEWNTEFSRFADLSAIRSICGDGPLEFVQLIYSYGYPDHYYACLQDPSQDNPTVFGTDHEEFFQQVRAHAPLEQFLNSYCTRSEFREIVLEHVKNLA